MRSSPGQAWSTASSILLLLSLSLSLSFSLSIPRAPPGLPTPETFTPFSLHRARSVPGFRATIYQRPPRGSLPMNSYLKRACRGRSLAAQQTGNTGGCNTVLRKLFSPGDDGMWNEILCDFISLWTTQCFFPLFADYSFYHRDGILYELLWFNVYYNVQH